MNNFVPKTSSRLYRRERKSVEKMKKEEQAGHILRLRTEVEAIMGGTLSTPKDFKRCSLMVFERLHSHVSVSTMKRLWGYVVTTQDYVPARFTLDTLSQFVGYSSFDAFCRSANNPDSIVLATERLKVLNSSFERITDHIRNLEKEIRILQSMIK